MPKDRKNGPSWLQSLLYIYVIILVNYLLSLVKNPIIFSKSLTKKFELSPLESTNPNNSKFSASCSDFLFIKILVSTK